MPKKCGSAQHLRKKHPKEGFRKQVFRAVAAQTPHLTDRQCQARLDITRAIEQWSLQDWGEVLFTDESTSALVGISSDMSGNLKGGLHSICKGGVRTGPKVAPVLSDTFLSRFG